MAISDLPTLAETNAQPRATPKAAKRCERCGLPARWRFCSRKCSAAVTAVKRRLPRATCAVCGKTNPEPHQEACSSACRRIARKRRSPSRRQKVCPSCKHEFWAKRQTATGLFMKYCSKRCYDVVRDHKKRLVDVECAQCHRMLKRRPAKATYPKKFCDAACMRAFYKGDQHPMYRGGSDPNRGKAWARRAEAIRKRDDYTCRRCGRSQAENEGKALSVDHIIPWRMFTDATEANDPTNLASLCLKCHAIKTMVIEPAWLRGDVLAMEQYRKALQLEPLKVAS